MKTIQSIEARKELTTLLQSKTGRKGDHVSFCYHIRVFSIRIDGIGCDWETGSFDKIKNYILENTNELKNI